MRGSLANELTHLRINELQCFSLFVLHCKAQTYVDGIAFRGTDYADKVVA